jgi:plasmid stabilization system protein ParE
MKSYRVMMPERVAMKIREQARYITEEAASPLNAARWLERVLEAVDSLAPHRCPFAAEHGLRPYDIRCLVVQDFLVVFTVDEEASCVVVLNVRHGRQLPQTDELPS